MKRLALLATAAAALSLVAAACGSGSGSGSGSGAGSGSGSGNNAAVTKSSGTPESGGTAVYAEAPGTSPNYIFPMLEPAYYTISNIEQFQRLSFRSLYWVGNAKGQPVVDPGMSLAALPTFTDHDSVATIHLNNYDWSDGQPVTARDVAFWINLLKADKTNFAAYIPGEFPDNLKSYKIVNDKTIQLDLTGSYNPTWFTENQLSQITPLPVQAWDKTSTSGKVGNYDETTSGAKAVFDYLTGQAKDISTYGSNPLWKTVDGPWILDAYQSDGYAKFAANKHYSGPSKPKLAYFVEQPYTTDSAELNVLRSGHTIDYGYVPPQEASQIPILKEQGYTTEPWTSWGISYALINFNNPTMGPLFHQAYFRQAMQSLIDEPAYLQGPLKGYGHTSYGPVPTEPASPYADSYETKGPWAYSPKTAVKLLSEHGWKVKPNGVSTCASPGTGASDCGAGVTGGEKAVINVAYATGTLSTSQEMQALKSSYSQAGIDVNLVAQTWATLLSDVSPCKPSQASCKWQVANINWTYGVNPYPTGDQLFATGSGSNFGNYSDKQADKIIAATVHGPGSLDAYEDYMADQVPVLWMPEPAYQISEVSKSLQGTMPQSPIESLTPEDWYFTK